MNQQEAYIELRLKLDDINKAVREAFAFAKVNSIDMGQPKDTPSTFEARDPTLDVADDWDYFDWWIGSAVCW